MGKSKPKASKNGHATEPPKACYVLSLEIENVRCFGPKQTLDLSDGNGRPAQWTIILGENGVGKTTLLQALVGVETISVKMHAPWEDFSDNRLSRYLLHRYPQNGSIDKLGFVSNSRPTDWAHCGLIVSQSSGLHDEIHHKPPTHPSWDVGQRFLKITAAPLGLVFFGYGAARRISPATLESSKDDDAVGTLFHEQATLRNAEEWLIRLHYASVTSTVHREKQHERFEQIKDLLIVLLPDDQVTDIRFISGEGPNPQPRVEFQTPYGWVPLRRLGHGFQTVIA